MFQPTHGRRNVARIAIAQPHALARVDQQNRPRILDELPLSSLFQAEEIEKDSGEREQPERTKQNRQPTRQFRAIFAIHPHHECRNGEHRDEQRKPMPPPGFDERLQPRQLVVNVGGRLRQHRQSQ